MVALLVVALETVGQPRAGLALPGSAPERSVERSAPAEVLRGLWRRVRLWNLQRGFRHRGRVYDPTAKKHIVVVPSLSVDPQELKKVGGAKHYEERLLFGLLHLRNPNNTVHFISSSPISPKIVDYYLDLLPDPAEARSRLRLYSARDASARPLTQKVNEQPELLSQLRSSIDRDRAHIYPFNVSPHEAELAVRLGVPLLGSTPDLSFWGTKAGSRRIFAEANVLHPPGSREVRTVAQLVGQIDRLLSNEPGAKRLVVKLNEGFSGEGNAILDVRPFAHLPAGEARRAAIESALPGLKFQADSENWNHFSRSLQRIGGIVELFVEGEQKTSPSVQGYIGPDGKVEILSTHEQVLGGPDGQVYLGCEFPAKAGYREQLQRAGKAVGERLAAKGALGRYAVDFVAVPERDGWKLHALEINLRAGGTTHPTNTLKLLVGGEYDESTGHLHGRDGTPKFYVATDNLEHPAFEGLAPEQLIDIIRDSGLGFDRKKGEIGSVLHLMGAVPVHKKLGFTAVANSRAEADALYERTERALIEGAQKLQQDKR